MPIDFMDMEVESIRMEDNGRCNSGSSTCYWNMSYLIEIPKLLSNLISCHDYLKFLCLTTSLHLQDYADPPGFSCPAVPVIPIVSVFFNMFLFAQVKFLNFMFHVSFSIPI